MSNVRKLLEERIERLTPLALEKGCTLEYQEKFVNHGLKYGISICRTDTAPSLSAVLYYDPDWFQKTDLEVLDILLTYVTDIPEIDLSVLSDREQVLSNVYPMILDYENLEAIKNTDYYFRDNKLFLILFYTSINMPNGKGTFKITRSLLETLHISEEELLGSAFKNAKDTLTIDPISLLLEGILDQISYDSEISTPSFYVISNKDKTLGAVNILLPETHRILSKKLGEKFIILPSSIHECIAIEYTDDIDDLVNMVTSINSTMVASEEQLNNHVYLCNPKGISLLK